MAVNSAAKTYSKMEFPLAIQRQNAFAPDPTRVWSSFEAASEYAQNDPTAYVGQRIAVVTDGISRQYQIKNAAGELQPLGGISEDDIAADADASDMIDEVFAENVLTVTYICNEEGHECNETKSFRYSDLGKVANSVDANSCCVHRYNWGTSLQELLNLLADGDNSVTLNASLEADKEKLANIVTLTPGDRTPYEEGDKIVIPIRATINLLESAMTDPCLDMSAIEITFGAMICNTKEDPDTETVRDAIRHGNTTIYNDEGGIVIVYTYSNTINMLNAKNHSIYMNINASEAVASSIKNTANYVKYTIAGVTTVVIA